MNQFILQQGDAVELHAFPHITELASKKNNSIQLNSLHLSSTNDIRIYYIIEGKFEWIINGKNHILFPGDLALILPGQIFGGDNNILNIGSLIWLHLEVEKMDTTGLKLGKWSQLSTIESHTIGKIFLLNDNTVLKLKEVQLTLQTLHSELCNQEIGYVTRVNQIIDELFITIARQSTRQNNSQRDFSQIFMKLEKTLRQNLAYQWTLEEMAALIGLGTTTFAERVKGYTGFSPLNYLINIRISEAMRLLNQEEINVTDIALSTGFNSSQHFATTFKKLTGYTPSEYRKRNLSQP